ncbi:MAG TPA: YhdP family protein [Burkholderiaceae bacterium]|nr:YhdP family protein [Burkholderiaceae bacterium]
MLERVERIEAEVERAVEHAVETGEAGLARRYGQGAVRGARAAVRGALIGLLLLYFVFCACVLALRYWVAPRIDEYRPTVEQLASQATGATVRIGRIEAGWDALNPRFALFEVRVADRSGRTALELPEVDATLSWTSLLKLRPSFAQLVLRSPELEILRLPGGVIEIGGFRIDPAAPAADSRALDWLLGQDRILVTGARIDLRDLRVAEAPRELVLRDIEFLFDAGLTSWRFGLRATPPADLAAPLDLRGRISRTPFERRADFSQWSGQLYAAFDYADLARLVHLLDLPIALTRGEGAARAWVDFERLQATRTRVDLALVGVDVRLAAGLEPLKLATLSGRVGSSRAGGTNSLEASGLSFRTTEGLSFGPAELTVRRTPGSAGKPMHTEVEASSLDLGALAALAERLPLPQPARALLTRHEPRGQLRTLRADWRGPLDEARDYTLKSDFAGLATRAQPAPADAAADTPGQPGFEGLTGSVEATAAGGVLRLASRDAVLDFPGVFAEPRLPFQSVDAVLRWTMRERLDLKLELLTLRNPDLELSAAGSWSATGGAGTIDLSGRVLRVRASEAHRYVPLAAGRGTIDWLRRALRAGRASDGQFVVRGPLAQFPWTDPAQGQFRVSARVDEVVLDYVPAEAATPDALAPVGTLWPELRDISGRLVFERDGLEVQASRLTVFGLSSAGARARIKHLDASARVEVDGEVGGPLADFVRFTNASPVGGWLGGFLGGAEARGNARLELQLDIPLAKREATRVVGRLNLKGNELLLPGGVPALTRLTGPVGFTERSLRIAGVTGYALGGPLRLDADTGTDGVISLVTSGRFTPAGVATALDHPAASRLLERASGEAAHRTTITIAPAGLEIRAESDLVGIAFNLPAPLRKTATEPLPLTLMRRPALIEGRDSDALQATLGNLVDVVLERRREATGHRVTRSAVSVGEAASLPTYGVSVNLALPRIDLDAWRPIYESAASATARPGAAAPPEQFVPDSVSLRTRELVLDGKLFRNVVLGATHMSDGLWNANLASDLVSGALTWRPARGTGARATEAHLTARLSRLAIPDNRRDEVAATLGETSAAQLPAVELVAEEFELGARKLGRLEVDARNLGSGQAAVWELQRLLITNPDGRFSATGRWAPEGGAGARRMGLAFTLDARNAGGLLDRLGIRDALRAGTGKLEGEIGWRGSPLGLDLGSLDGRLKLEIDRGQFLKADPGAARLLSVLSLQTLARRMTLDFSDTFADGFAFDTVRADALINSGLITTRNFRMIGPAATVLLDGTINLRNETQDLKLAVLPDVNATSASLALAVVNPAVGLGSLVAQLVLKDPLSKLFSVEFEVQGSWTDPQIRKLERTPVSATPTTTP